MVKHHTFTLFLTLFFWYSYSQSVMVLGVAQDGGFPHIGCMAKCQEAYQNPELSKMVVSLAVMDSIDKKWYLMDASPDLSRQLQFFHQKTNGTYPYLPEGIFLTHAHMGHYTGLMHLGREALGASNVKVYGLPKMMNFLKTNGPWSQLVALNNITINPLEENEPAKFGDIQITAFTVPHRDELSETAGIKIETSSKKYLYIPDIDKWSEWEKDIRKEVQIVDVAFLDASFFADGELPNRSIDEVPHPFVSETMELFEKETEEVKNAVHFIHLNHTNPLLWDKVLQKEVEVAGFNLSKQGGVY